MDDTTQLPTGSGDRFLDLEELELLLRALLDFFCCTFGILVSKNSHLDLASKVKVT